MSESETNNPLEAAAASLTGEPTATTEPQGDPADVETLGEGGKKAIKAEREARAAAERQLTELKAKLDAIEAANMTDLERAQKAAAEAQSQVAKVPEMVADQLRGHLTAIHQITDDDRDLYLTSSDPATLLKQAVGIAARQATASPSTPKPDLTQGAQTAIPLNGDGLTDALARAVGATST